MKFIIVLFILTSLKVLAVCDLPQGTVWLEHSGSYNRLKLRIPNDRNIYFSYFLSKNGAFVHLSHRIYVCSGKNLYLVTEDDTVELYAHVEKMSHNEMKLHFVNGYEIIGALEFIKITD